MNRDQVLALGASWAAKTMAPDILALGFDTHFLRQEFPRSQVFLEVVTESKREFDVIVADGDSESLTIEELKKRLAPTGVLIFGSQIPRSSAQSSLPWTLADGSTFQVNFYFTRDEMENHTFLQAACYPGYAEDYMDDVEFLKKWLGHSDSVLEVGIGCGRLARLLHTQTKDYRGIDYSAAMLRTLKREGMHVEVEQASMLDFKFDMHFDRIFYPFRVFHYLRDDNQMLTALINAARHLKRAGSILINMIEFDQKFIDKWDKKSVINLFTGPDGTNWQKIDYMEFRDRTMFRRIELERQGIVACRTNDDLTWRSVAELSELCARAGLRVSNVWPAYQFTSYNGESEYVLEAKLH
jgi:SAM-dependent methyltransferase